MRYNRSQIYPVLTDDNKLAGVILLDDLHPILFDEEKYTTVQIRDMIHLPGILMKKAIILHSEKDAYPN